VWVNPVLQLLLLGGMGWGLFKRVGPIPAGLFLINLVSLGDVGWEFQALRPDHQSLQALFGMFLLAGLVFGGAGWIRTTAGLAQPSLASKPLEVPELREARRWFLISGACAALSLWISAVVAVMLLAMLFGAGLLLAFSAPTLPENSVVQVRPELWRWWGWIAGAGSLFFYFLEYFPHHLDFRLEVNSPLYSMVVVAMGEAICQFLRARYAQRHTGLTPFLKGLACTGIVALVPLAIFFGPASWHALKDPQMFRLHNFIQEFYSFPRFAGPRLNAIIVENFGILPAFFLLAIALAAFGNLRLHEWAVVWLSFAATFGVLGLGYFQVRWLGLYAAMNTWLAVVVGVCAWRLIKEHLTARLHLACGLIVVALLLFQPVWFCKRRIGQVEDIIRQRTIPTELANPVLNKRLALAFRSHEGAGKRVLADPNIVPALHYFGESAGVASFYWENINGLHDATRFLADSDGEVARQVASERGLTHVMVQEGNRLQNYFYFIATGKIDEGASRQIFAARLVGSEFQLPPWLQTDPGLQQIGLQLYTYCEMRFEERWRIYRISARP
jgi:hypothetical protein